MKDLIMLERRQLVGSLITHEMIKSNKDKKKKKEKKLKMSLRLNSTQV